MALRWPPARQRRSECRARQRHQSAPVTLHGVRPGMAEHPLQVAVARLLGYRWPRQTGSSFMDCPAVSEPDEVDRSGLVDADGIVPLAGARRRGGRGDAVARTDPYGLGAGLRRGHDPRPARSRRRRRQRPCKLGSPTNSSTAIAGCSTRRHSSGTSGTACAAVSPALVNYHRLCEGNGAGRRLLEKLRDTYLGEWIAAQRRANAAGDAGAEERLIAAEHLRGELTKIIDGDPPYDIFVRWKPLHRQPIGWEPDIDDGVRLNIRPFLTAKPRNPGRKDACILRVTPRVKKHAGADRGAEPLSGARGFPLVLGRGRRRGDGELRRRRRTSMDAATTISLHARVQAARPRRQSQRSKRSICMSDRTLIHGLARALTDAAQTYDAGKEWPAALLWPDPERQWSGAFADLRRRLASQGVALYAYGDYAPDEGIGPSIWLRCLIEAPGTPNLKGVISNSALPVVLLPGISWRALREPLTLTKGLQTLVEMQYRGDVFRQRRQARDWTVATFLRDPDQGLGLDVATDSRTDEAARRTLAGLLDLPLDGWRDRHLGADDFDGLLVEDKERDLLRWIANPDATRAAKVGAAWDAFRDQIKRDYGIDVEQKGELQKAVERLARRSGAWRKVWDRLADTPQQFRPVCERIRETTQQKQGDLLEDFREGDPVINPHDNATAEKVLAQDLSELANLSSREAAEKVIALEERNRARRGTLWARLGEAPLAAALEPSRAPRGRH